MTSTAPPMDQAPGCSIMYLSIYLHNVYVRVRVPSLRSTHIQLPWRLWSWKDFAAYPRTAARPHTFSLSLSLSVSLSPTDPIVCSWANPTLNSGPAQVPAPSRVTHLTTGTHTHTHAHTLTFSRSSSPTHQTGRRVRDSVSAHIHTYTHMHTYTYTYTLR